MRVRDKSRAWTTIFFRLALLAGCLVMGACEKTESPAESSATESAAPANEAHSGPETGKAQAQDTADTAVEPPAGGTLMDPSQANDRAPEKYTVVMETGKGEILIDVQRKWAPLGADRFYNLVKAGFYTDVAFFRVIPGFMVQTGIHGTPAVNKVWRTATIKDDPVTQSNVAGMVTFATSGPNSRTTQFFINFGNNARLDGMGFAPFGKVRSMDVVNSIYAEYGPGPHEGGRGPSQQQMQTQGNAYLKAQFPKLDYIVSARIQE